MSTSLNGLGLNLLQARESGFLKMYQYIAGGLRPIVWGEGLAQLFVTLSEILIFTVITSLVFRQPVFLTVTTGVLLVILAWIPLSIFFSEPNRYLGKPREEGQSLLLRRCLRWGHG